MVLTHTLVMQRAHLEVHPGCDTITQVSKKRIGKNDQNMLLLVNYLKAQNQIYFSNFHPIVNIRIFLLSKKLLFFF